MKKTRLHCFIGKRLGGCAVTQAIRRARRARLSDKPTLGRRLVDQTRKTDSLRFSDENGDYDCLPYLPRFPSREVTITQMGKTNGSVLALRRHARTSRSGSVTRPVSLRRWTRRSMEETCTPKCLATCCCLCPCIGTAIA